MATSTITSDVYIDGNLTPKTFSPPAGSITATSVVSSAGIEATKLQHQHQQIVAQVHGSNASAERRTVHFVRGATGTIVAFECGNVVAATGDSTATINLKKNGSNILSSATVLDNSNTAFANEDAAGFTSTALVAGDVLEVDITVSAGTGTLPQGVFACLTLREDAA
jgi:hypothetical protein